MDKQERIKEIDKKIEELNKSFVDLHNKLDALYNEKSKLENSDVIPTIKVGDYIAISSEADGIYDKYMRVDSINIIKPTINLTGPSFNFDLDNKDDVYMDIYGNDLECIGVGEKDDTNVVSIISKEEFKAKFEEMQRVINEILF